ncbi:MAG: glycoside hydrolase family 3 C-terminal domain-containing protein [Prevotella sp.]|nr:glycoside hydrolase family 3 C-terminal domain-containing protein [Prevotella sp.]
MKFKSFILNALSVMLVGVASAQTYPYQDPSLSFHERAKDLVSRLTLEEKINQVGHQTMAITRNGINLPKYNYWNEALHGVARSGAATSFPVSRAMSSTWHRQLIFDCAQATANEARVYYKNKGKGLIYWCPTINMSRDPRWGRDEENYGEDPFLTGTLAVEYIKAMQGNDEKFYKTVATAKHYAANNYEHGRHSTSSNIDARNLREYYLPAFEMAVKEANVRSIMSAYNAVNGIPCGASHELLVDILRGEWGFNGFVTSDCGAVDDIYQSNRHHYVNTAAEASAIAIKNGMDLNCGTTFQDPEGCKAAIEQGLMTEANLDSALVRVLEARFAVGEFETVKPFADIKADTLECATHRALALQASREAIVLLKNQDNMLPLDATTINKIAIIGPCADNVQLGGYSGTPTYQKPLLNAIAEVLNYNLESDGTIQAENFDRVQGKGGIDNPGIGNIQNGDIFTYNNVDFGAGKGKLKYSYAGRYGNRQLTIRIDNATTGTIVYQETLPATANNWTTFVEKDIVLSAEAAAITGTHTVYLIFNKLSTADDTNKYIINLDWFRFYNEGDLSPTALGNKVMYVQGCSVSGAKEQSKFDEAVAMAQAADYVILALGTDLNVSDESRDRNNLNLPGAQQQLLEAVYAANPKTIVVLNSCSSLTINWAQQNVPSILEAWYDGQEQGTAISDVIFGNYNPSGKLTTTWYNATSDLPSGMLNYDIRAGKYTYMYHHKTPLYPFGFGLSYTTYEYSNLKVSKNILKEGEEISVTFDVKNTGNRAGAEIVQLYTHANSSIERPIKELKGFDRIELQPGETKTVSLTLRHEQLSYYNMDNNTFDVEQGTVDVMIGASSADIRLQTQINTEAATVKYTYLHKDPTAINAVKTNDKLANDRVYNMQGLCVSTGGSFESLPKGMYIMKGQKYIKKLR